MVPKPVVAPGERIRVARIITRLNVGGPAIQAMLLTGRLDPEHFETLLICGRVGAAEGDMLALRREHGVVPIVIPTLGRGISPLDDIRAFLSIVGALRAFRPHVVHTHLAKAGLLGRLAAALLRVPVVVHTFHGNVLSGYFGAAKSGLFLGLERLLARLSTRIIAISERQAGELRRLGVAHEPRLLRVPLGLDLAPFLDAPSGLLRRELGVGQKAPLVGIVARLVPIKAIGVFLRAVELIIQEQPGARFVIVGDGEERGRLEADAAARGLAAHIHWLGWRGDLPAIYADLDVVVLTSRNEGTPVSLIEAQAAGRAVVATEVGGVADIVVPPKRGILVPDGDHGALARAVLDLLADDERRHAMGAAGRAAVYPEYDSATLVRRIEGLYRGLFNQGRGGGPFG